MEGVVLVRRRMRVRNRLRELREARGVSLYRLGQDLGIAPMTLWRIENGKRAPQPDTAERLADYFGVAPAELFRFEDEVSESDKTGAGDDARGV